MSCVQTLLNWVYIYILGWTVARTGWLLVATFAQERELNGMAFCLSFDTAGKHSVWTLHCEGVSRVISFIQGRLLSGKCSVVWVLFPVVAYTTQLAWVSTLCTMAQPTIVTDLNVKDVRFPTSLDKAGSDSVVSFLLFFCSRLTYVLYNPRSYRLHYIIYYDPRCWQPCRPG